MGHFRRIFLPWFTLWGPVFSGGLILYGTPPIMTQRRPDKLPSPYILLKGFLLFFLLVEPGVVTFSPLFFLIPGNTLSGSPVAI